MQQMTIHLGRHEHVAVISGADPTRPWEGGVYLYHGGALEAGLGGPVIDGVALPALPERTAPEWSDDEARDALRVALLEDGIPEAAQSSEYRDTWAAWRKIATGGKGDGSDRYQRAVMAKPLAEAHNHVRELLAQYLAKTAVITRRAP